MTYRLVTREPLKGLSVNIEKYGGKEVITRDIKEDSADIGSADGIAGEASQDDSGDLDYRSSPSFLKRI